MGNKADQFCNQAANSPLDSKDTFDLYFDNLRNSVSWNRVGILTDEGDRNTIILLMLNEELTATMRLCLEPKLIKSCINTLSAGSETVTYRCLQGYAITRDDLIHLHSIASIWVKAEAQSAELTLGKLESLFTRFEEKRKKTGRGPDFTNGTKETVWRDSFGRCMFTGCGEKLDYDEVSGTSGNYAYLAHNVASSEKGARGITELSEKLSNNPSNVLLLCDKHHRLIDKVAASDYPASTLSSMREEFGLIANSLLDGLKYQPIPVYAVLWPVNSQTVSPPSYLQVANSLSRIKRRMHQQINILSHNEELLVDSPDVFWAQMPSIIQVSADKIIQQTKKFGFNAALFGFGPTSALIGFGAKIGNKNAVTPMLRFRESGSWSWPAKDPIGEFYEVVGFDQLKKGTDFVINIALTAEPQSLVQASKSVCKYTGAQMITIRAKESFMGNGAIPHPEDGRAFTAVLQSMLHGLKSKYGAQTIHLFPCASNAASVFIGQAYDVHHPKVIVYDFDNGTMVPRICLESESHKCSISSIQHCR
ncbi:SAVED domain-containing protein [Paraferrimonas haliotis]|uniref:SAVED domain-containing protein n=1 Tax=Paraferrimonas haliotis TaxID=2013866 RepID=UPI000BA91AAE|nr:SAVED domain-containing protein [Paraferrimonas haliotis]